MPAPDTAFIKTWCRIDGTEFDALLPDMIADATARAGHETGVDYAVADMPASVRLWVAASVKHWIDNPSASVARDVPRNPYFDGLLSAHRNFAMEQGTV